MKHHNYKVYLRKLKRILKKKYQWEGLNEHYQIISGFTYFSRKQLTSYLTRNKILLLKITKLKSIPRKNIIIFWQMLNQLLQKNLGLIDALILLNQQQPAWYFITDILKSLKQGQNFNQCLLLYPTLFNFLTRQLIKTGENTGKLVDTTQYLSNYLDTLHQTKKKIIKSMIYPIFLLSLSIIIQIFFCLIILPQFYDLLENKSLPLITKLIFKWSIFIKKWLIISIIFTVIIIYFNRKKIIKLPILKTIYKLYYQMNLAKILTLSLQSGLDILSTFRLLTPIFPTSKQIILSLQNGVLLSEALNMTKQLDPFFIQMTKIGENTGNLPENFTYLVNYYQQKIDSWIKNLNVWLEPGIMLFISVLVGILAIGIYLPIFQLDIT